MIIIILGNGNRCVSGAYLKLKELYLDIVNKILLNYMIYIKMNNQNTINDYMTQNLTIHEVKKSFIIIKLIIHKVS